MVCIKSKITFNIIILIITIIFIACSSIYLLNCMIEYKYHIEENFDHANLYYTYSDRKWELSELMLYLKCCIAYFIFIFIYFIYQIRNK